MESDAATAWRPRCLLLRIARAGSTQREIRSRRLGVCRTPLSALQLVVGFATYTCTTFCYETLGGALPQDCAVYVIQNTVNRARLDNEVLKCGNYAKEEHSPV